MKQNYQKMFHFCLFFLLVHSSFSIVIYGGRNETSASAVGYSTKELENNQTKRTYHLKVNSTSCLSQIADLQAQLEELQANFQRMEIKHDVDKVKILNRNDMSFARSLRDKDYSEGEPIGFFATISIISQTTYDGETIKFDNVVSNYGNGYNKFTGVFTCPTPGLYQLWATMLAKPGHILDFALVKNNNVVSRGFAKDMSSLNYDSGTALAILNLEIGDVVFVQCRHGNTDENIHGDHYSHFGGHLIN